MSNRNPLDESARSGLAAAVRRGGAVFDWLSRRPSRSVWACGILGLTLAATLTIASGFPPPSIHDEFSYLLAGDTFANGRLANPTHPMWRHFETFHELQTPTYASKYPPAQGLALALGQRMTGVPIVGIWISCALLVAALNWMLLAWTRPRWALWGAAAAAFWIVGRHASEGYWASSYWGGTVPALGGALVLGGVRRLARESTLSASVAVGVGLAVIASSRPFEGLFFAIAPLTVIAWLVIRQIGGRQWRPGLITLVPMTLVLGVAAVFNGFYNRSVTGSAMRPPYLEYDKAYTASPHLIGQNQPPTPVYRVAVIEKFFTAGTGHTNPPRGLRQYATMLRRNAASLTSFVAPWFVVPLLFALPWAVRGAWMLLALTSLVSVGLALALTLYTLQPHYAAPAAGAWCILLTRGGRYVAQLSRRRQLIGRGITRLIFACIVASAMAQIAIGLVRQRGGRNTSWSWQRKAIERSLSDSGRHLILVEYGPRHVPDHEWVFNRAVIDEAPVVWARSLDTAEDAELRRYFASRTAWRLRIDDDKGPFDLTALAPPMTDAKSQSPGHQ